MRERHVLASCIKSRDAFTLIANHVNRDDLSEQGRIVWEGISRYYDGDVMAPSVDPDILSDQITRGIAVDKHKDLFRRIVEDLSGFEVSPANVVEDLIATKREVLEQKLAAAFAAKEPVAELLAEYDRLAALTDLGEDDKPEIRQGLSVEDLVNTSFTAENLIHINPPPLNDVLEEVSSPATTLSCSLAPRWARQ